MLIFMTSVAALTYKVTQLMEFPTIWSEHQAMRREANELEEREAELVAAPTPAVHTQDESDDDDLDKLFDLVDSERSNSITRDEWQKFVTAQKKLGRSSSIARLGSFREKDAPKAEPSHEHTDTQGLQDDSADRAMAAPAPPCSSVASLLLLELNELNGYNSIPSP